MKPYDHRSIEEKWQKRWEEEKVFAAKDFDERPKFFGLVEFPYPSGDGLHVGHPRSYTAMDVICRKKRMSGYNVLLPIGFDAFGLPAENYAIKTGTHPAVTTKKNIENFTRQLKSLGYSFDWDRAVDTTDPSYYRWTQWIFLQLFKHGLAYKTEAPTNWCVSCMVTLANEEVVNGRCERCGNEVVRKMKKQWMLRITAYAEKLLEGLNHVEYLDVIKEQQRNWIGKSTGAEVFFPVKGSEEKIHVFTTRHDTIFGTTYLVLSPEHPLVEKLTSDEQRAYVTEYQKEAQRKSDLDRTALDKEKTGVFTGGYAVNPVNGDEIPVWIADYVLASYGTGAVMGVPCHDERDYDFAKKYHLPVIQVVQKDADDARSILMGGKDIADDDLAALEIRIVERGEENLRKLEIPKASLGRYETLICEKMQPGFWNEYIGDETVFLFKHQDGTVQRFVLDMKTADEIDALAAKFNSESGWNKKNVWSWLSEDPFYRPFIIHEDDGILINSDFLNGCDVETAKAKTTAWLESHQCGKAAVSYKLRDWVFSRQRYWGEPIPMIECGACGFVPVSEEDLPVLLPDLPAYKPSATGESPLAELPEFVNVSCTKCGGSAKRETDTMPQWAGSSWYFLRYTDARNSEVLADAKKLAYWMPVDLYSGGPEHITLHLLYSRFWNQFLHDIGAVPVSEPYQKRVLHGLVMGEGGVKMSKSKGNVVNPDAVVSEHGADTFRTYILFMGPFDQAIPWDSKGLIGVKRFLDKVWKLGTRENVVGYNSLSSSDRLERLLHKTIKKVSEDIDALKFNTAISALMIYLNELETGVWFEKEFFVPFLKLLSPFAPHIAEELWSRIESGALLSQQPWPQYNESLIKDDTLVIPIQINGKVRDTVSVSADISEEEISALIQKREKVQKWLEGRTPKKIIYVQGRLVSIVV